MSASDNNAPKRTAGDPVPSDKERESIGYLLVSHTLEVGGIETLVVRMANAIAATGAPVAVLAPEGPMARHFSADVEHLRWDGRASVLADYRPPATARHLDIWCSMPEQMIDAWPLQHRLWRGAGITSSCTAGIFHPMQWYHDGAGSASYWKGRLFQALAEPGAIYFMNDASRAAHVARWGGHLEPWPVFRLHLEDDNGLHWRPGGSTRLRIASVGRVVPFKNYNYDAAAILGELAARGIDASWTIYGDGEDRPRLMAEADAAGLGSRLTFPGEIAYDTMQRSLLDYDLFVGMGTAALEAAAIGMPTILALSDVPRGSYGFLDEAPSDSVAEVVDGVAPIDLGECIARFAGMSDDERLRTGARCRRSIADRSGDERAPFAAMFAAGRQVPAGPLNTIRNKLLLTLRSISRRSLS